MTKPQLLPLFLPVLFFLSLSLSFQSAFSSELIEDATPQDVKKKVLGELVKVVGRPNVTVGGENAEWAVKSVVFIMNKMNWTFDLSGHESDLKYIEKAVKLVVTAFGWILDDPELDPYRSFTKGLTTFRSLFKYISELERGLNYGGEQNPVYRCFKGYWYTCISPAPATLQGAVVYRFDCGFHFYSKCELKKWAQDGTWHVPIIDGAQFGLHALIN